MVKLKAAGGLLGAATALVLGAVSVSADWTTYHFDNAHTGYDAGPAAVTSFSSNWSRAVDGLVMAEPLYFGGLVYVVTMHDNLYALNSADGTVAWSKHIDDPFPAASIICNSVPGDAVGIMSTPVIDPVANVIYMVGMTSLGYYHMWAFDLSTHNLVYAPVSVDPFPIDPGYTMQTEQNNYQNQRGALALNSGGTLFIPYGGRDGDCGKYHGYVIGVHAPDGTGVISYHTTLTSREAGIWAPGGVALDASGNAFVATGNAANCAPPYDDGNQVVKLSPSLVQMTSWAPSNWASLNCSDTDVGSTAPSLVGSGRVFQSGKNGRGYLLDATNMGGIGGEIFSAQVCSSSSFGANAYANGIIYVPCQDGMHALTLAGSGNSFSAAWNHTGFTAGPPIVTAGAVWVINTGGSTLEALSPTTGNTIGSANLTGAVGHFVTPAEGGGNIYVPGDGYVQAFSIGQWKASYSLSSAPTTWAAGQSQTFPVTVTNTGTTTWPSTGYTAVELDLHFTTVTGGSAQQSHWLNSQAFSISGDLAPSASVIVTVTFAAPSTTGSMFLEAEMIKEHQFWFTQVASVAVTVNPPPTPIWSASFDMSTVPTTWQPGVSQTFSVKVTNIGNVTWPSTGYNEVDLDLHFATSSGGSANVGNWLTSQALPLGADVAQSTSATVTFTLTAPAGSTVLEALMIKEHQFWFDAKTPSPQQWASVTVTIPQPIWSATIDMSTVPTTWKAGESKTFSVKVTNSGNVTWPSTGYNEVDFDLHFATSSGGSANVANWINSKAVPITGDLAPSSFVTLSVTFTAPETAGGSLTLEALMIKEHQFWFDSKTPAPQQWAPITATVTQATSVTVTNTSAVTWISTGYNEFDLDFHFTSVTGGSAQQAHWTTSQAFSLPSDVPPAGSVTFNVMVTAPSSTGAMFLEAEMIKEHSYWFTQVASVSVTVS